MTPGEHKANDAIVGCLLGVAAGDSLGLVAEGLSRRRQRRLYPGALRQRLLFNKGLCSDDTEHTCMVSQALIAAQGEADRFARIFAFKLRFWLLGLPAGIGFATLRAIVKLWLGFSPRRSGVDSAGNGPAMRSAIIGVYFREDLPRLRAFVIAGSRITHTDPRAVDGALAIALGAAKASYGLRVDPQAFLSALAGLLDSPERSEIFRALEKSCAGAGAGESTQQYADGLGLSKGVSGFVMHTVPVVVHCWLRHQGDYRGGIEEIIRCGGDTDTTAAILGGMLGAQVGESGIAPDWLAHIAEFPRNLAWMRKLGMSLAKAQSGIEQRQLALAYSLVVIRNLLFMFVVLYHGFRRLLPPY